MASNEACATILEDMVLQIQTIVGELFVIWLVNTPRSINTEGNKTRQETMLMVIRFITNLKIVKHD